MRKEILRKYDFLIDFLMDIFNINTEEFKSDIQKSVKVVSVNLEKLGNELKNTWKSFYEKSYDFISIQKEYIEKFQPWKEKYNAFRAIKNNYDLLNFLENYFSTWMKLSFESKDISENEIADILRHEKPTFSLLTQKYLGSYTNLDVFEGNLLQLKVHLKLKKYRTETYSLVIIFSFWFENTKKSGGSSLEFINENYKDTMTAYNVIKKLKSLDYVEDSLELKKKETGNKFITSSYSLIEKDFRPSNNLILEILSGNPIILFKQLVSHLYQVDEVIQNYTQEQNFSPTSYFENLTIELKQFLLKGKELFLKAEDLFQKSKVSKDKMKPELSIVTEGDKIPFEQVIAFFKNALENDKHNDLKMSEDKGFRTQNQIYDEYKENINASKPTFYNYFETLKFESFLEVRNKSGKGGGKEYRYKEIPADSDYLQKESDEIAKGEDQKNLTSERIEIQEALTSYNNKNYNQSIQIFTRVLTSKELQSDPTLYCASLYYLGRSYFKNGEYKKALENFNKAYMRNQSLYNVRYSLVESYLNLQLYEDALTHVNEIIYDIRNLFETSKMNLNHDYIFVRPFDLEIYDKVHPELIEKNLFSQFLILLNKPSIKAGLYPPPNPKLSKEIIDNVSRNILSIQILYKKYLGSAFLKLEIFRRQFFREVAGKNNDKAMELTKDFLQYYQELLEDQIIQQPLPNKDYEGYISYFKGISMIFNLPEIYKKIVQEFPNFEMYTVYPKNYYLFKFEQFYDFLSWANGILFKDFKSDDRILHLQHLSKRRIRRERITNPVLNAEYYFLEAYINLNYLMDDRIKSEEDLNQSLDLTLISSVEEVFKHYDEYHSRWSGTRHPIFFIDMANKAHDYCKKHQFILLTKLTKNILKSTQEKLDIVEKLRLERRNKVINKKLEILNEKYNNISENINLTFQMKPKEGFIHFIQFRLKRELERVLREKVGTLTFNVHLFNPELNKDVIKALSKETLHRESVEGRTRTFFIVKMELEENKTDNSIIIKTMHFRDLEKESGGFGETLDKVNWLIYNAINLNINSFTVRLAPEDCEKYRKYFDKEFKIEYDNEYFDFTLLENWENNEITLKIKKF